MLLNTISGMDLKAISSICCAGRILVPGLESENRRVLLSASLCEKNLVTGVFAFKCQTEFPVAGFFPVFSFLWTLFNTAVCSACSDGNPYGSGAFLEDLFSGYPGAGHPCTGKKFLCGQLQNRGIHFTRLPAMKGSRDRPYSWKCSET